MPAAPFHKLIRFQFPVVDDVGPHLFSGATFRLKLPCT
jgi:hypothetical protein